MLPLMLHVHPHLDPFGHQKLFRIASKINKKTTSISKLISESIFFNFSLLPDRFWIDFGSKMAGILEWITALVALPASNSTPKAVAIRFGSDMDPTWDDFGKDARQVWE